MGIHLSASFIEQANCICIEILGESPASDAEVEQVYQVIEEWSTRYNTKNVIVDYTKLRYKPNVLQILNSFELFKKYHIADQAYRFAMILEQHSETAKNLRLFITEVATKVFFRKLKFTYKIFFTYEEALAWIHGHHHKLR